MKCLYLDKYIHTVPPPSNNNHQDYYMFSREISIHLHWPLLLVHARFIHIFTSISYLLSTKKTRKNQEKKATTTPPTVDGSEILHQVSLVVYDPIVYLQGFFNTSQRWFVFPWNFWTCHHRFWVPIMCFPQDTVYLAPRSCCSLSPLVNRKYPPDAVERSRRGHRNASGDPGWAWNLQCSNLVGSVKLRFPLGENPGGFKGPQIKQRRRAHRWIFGGESIFMEALLKQNLVFWRVKKKHLATKILKERIANISKVGASGGISKTFWFLGII